MADINVNEIVARHGVPVLIVPDRDMRFISIFGGDVLGGTRYIVKV